MDMKLFLQALAVLLMLWSAWHSWTTARNAARQIQVNTMAQDIREVTTRVTILEEQMRHLPDDDLVNALAGDMKEVKAELRGFKEALGPLVKSLDRINDYLLNQSKK